MSLITRKRLVEELIDGCVLYMPLWENAGTKVEDLSGMNNHGTFNNAPLWVAGDFGYAVQFVPTSFIFTPHNDSLNVVGNQFSFSAWVKRLNTQADFSWWIDYDTYVTNGYYAFSYPNTPDISCGFHGAGLVQILTIPITNGAWTHIAATLDNTLMTVYKNGAYVDSRNDVPAVGVGSENLYLGGLGAAYAVDGCMDEIRFFNFPLSAAQVFEEYYRGARFNY